MLRKDLIDFFEKLRSQRGFSQERFIEDIISMTQYRRYLNYETAIPLKVVVAFSERLGFKYDSVLNAFDPTENKEQYLAARLMSLITTNNFKDYDALVKQLDATQFVRKRNRLIYSYTLVLSDLFRNKIKPEHALEKLKSLIDYPNILKSDLLAVGEFTILGEILTLLPADKQKEPLDYLKNVISEPRNLISENNEKMVIMLIVRIVKTLGTNKKSSDALIYCLTGIKICRATSTFYSLDYLYYYAALCYNEMADYKKRDQMIYLAFMAASVIDDPHTTEKFTKLLDSSFHISTYKFIQACL